MEQKKAFNGQAMIFAAGLGTRFKPWTDRHPKALAVVNNRTLLERNIAYLQSYGIHDVIVNVHHFPDQLEDAIKSNEGWGSRIVVSDEREALLDTGGGLKKAKPLFAKGQRFITCNADILTDLDIHKLLAFHEKKEALISFGVTQRKTSRSLLFDEQDLLCGWRNAQTGEERIVRGNDVLTPKAYSCVAVFEYAVLDLIPFEGKFSLIDVYLHLAKTHRIAGYDHTGDRWVDVGRPESVQAAEALFP
jgi:NDP-sugar pyrophosphorylase family protein